MRLTFLVFLHLLVGDAERIRQGARRVSAPILFRFIVGQAAFILGQSGKRPEWHPRGSSNSYHAANAERTDTIARSRGGIGRAPKSEVSKERDRSGPGSADSKVVAA